MEWELGQARALAEKGTIFGLALSYNSANDKTDNTNARCPPKVTGLLCALAPLVDVLNDNPLVPQLSLNLLRNFLRTPPSLFIVIRSVSTMHK